MFENVGGEVSIGDEREHAQGIAAARTVSDLVAETLRNSAAQSSLRASLIDVGSAVIVLAVPRRAGVGDDAGTPDVGEDKTP